jgi:thymidylate kinase
VADDAELNPVTIVSFSGIDGAGKSTQIGQFECWLHELGLTTRLFTFWDDVVVLSPWREFMSYKAFKGERGVGSPQKPVQRRDKNVTSFPVIAVRFLLYFADALNLRRKVAQSRQSADDVVIFDRYIYDELANLPLKRSLARFFARFILRITPKPDLAFVIDAHPDAAHARKPEYPLEFVRRNREAYLALADLSATISVVPPGSLEAMQTRIREEATPKLPLQRLSHMKAATILPSRVYPPANISRSEFIEP